MRASSSAIITLLAAVLVHLPQSIAAVPSALPASLNGTDPRTLSSGLYLSFALDGRYGGLITRPSALVAASGINKGIPPVTLDARVGDDIRLGEDPAPLPSSQNSQAEPHIWRSAVNSELLVATFQEGRFAADGGALDTGYAVSIDGGVSWRRGLIPGLTATSGGIYARATDPAAAVDLNGQITIVTLASRNAFADGGTVVVCRSNDNGATFLPPVPVANGTASVMLDKEWIAVNDYVGTPHPNRLVVTYTSINGNTYNLYSAYSDSAGATWSTPLLIKPSDSYVNQATQPFFLPDGSLLVAYITRYANGTFRIECKRSTDGGATYPATSTVAVSSVSEWVDPELRNGSFLITLWIARQSGAAFLTYAARDNQGLPRVFVTRSTDNGATWSVPVVASDNPAGISVINPAVAATPDGQQVTVMYYDKRNTPVGGAGVVDVYSNTSYDGGATWQPGLRLTEYSSNYRVAPLTDSGYMLGDYQGLVPPYSADQPAVAITMDTREGNADPYAIRYRLATAADYTGWQIARFSRAEFADPSSTGPLADFDGDGLCNVAEFTHQTNPRVADTGSIYQTVTTANTFTVTYRYRAAWGPAVSRWATSTDAIHWSPTNVSPTPNDFPTPSDNTGMIQFPLTSSAPVYFREETASDQTYADAVPGEVLVAHSDSRLVNVSTRGQVKTGESQLIVGFVISGGAKSILVRGVGPTLAGMGVSNPLPDPQLDLTAIGVSNFTTLHNNDWSQGAATTTLFARLGAQPLPEGSLDSAIVATLDAHPYSALLSDTQGRTGIALIEAYDADATPGAPTGPHLVNLSSRGEVGAGDNVLIGGFVINGNVPKRILLRAVGPTLADQGVVNVLSDPVLTLYHHLQSSNLQIGANDDWKNSPNAAALAATALQVGAFSLRDNSRDAALLVTLPPGIYSTIVSGSGGTTGVALVEIYDAD